ncbi:MAG TPA: acyl-CoA dehydrogenase family protein [Candidatus Thermoplasmatota archaeon]|nr:acyl-CoA dehydrogenase family protein [Candidatus Thermoplasmatota archaeon]
MTVDPVDPYLETRHGDLLQRARAFSVSKLEPLEEQAEHDLPAAARRCVAALAGEGFLRSVVPKAFGGERETVEVRSVASVREGIAYGSGLADAMLALQGLGSLPITLAGTDAQRRHWLPRVADGRAIAAFAVTEPEAGSDVASMQCLARETPEGWTLSGTKTFISNAGLADLYAVFAKTDPERGHRGVSAFLVPGDTPGLSVTPLRLLAHHPIGTVRFDGVRVPPDAILGRRGEGFKLALATLDRMRPTVAAAACGMASRALDLALARAKSRRQFGRALGENQGLRWRLAEAATDLQAARLLVYRAAWLADAGKERVTTESAQAKLFATEAAQRIVDFALQVHGGQGTVAGSPVERLYREVRALRIYEGTSEVLRDVVARSLFET